MNYTSNFTRFEGYILEKLQSFEYILMLNDTDSTQIKIRIPEESKNELNEGQFISCLGQAKNKHVENMGTETYFEVKTTN